MVNFSLIDDASRWNELLASDSNSSPYQLYQWGEYKKSSGWKVASIFAENSKRKSCLQITYKRKFGIFVGWCVGSINGDASLFSKEDLFEYLKKEFSVKYIFIKASFTNPFSSEVSFSLYSSGWDKSKNNLNSDYSIYVDLAREDDLILSTCSKNFKRNVKRGIAHNTNITVKKLSEYDELTLNGVFNRFRELKDVPVPSLQEIQSIKNSISDNILVATSEIDGEIVGLRACLYHGNRAVDFWAATDLVGRKHYTSFVLLYELLLASKINNVTEYDMAGIEPRYNKSVFDFKNGLRSGISERCGEWEVSNSKLLQFVVDEMYLKYYRRLLNL